MAIKFMINGKEIKTPENWSGINIDFEIEKPDNLKGKRITECKELRSIKEIMDEGRMGCYITDHQGNLFGTSVQEKWIKAAWYHKVIGFFWSKYKLRFIYIKPFEIE